MAVVDENGSVVIRIVYDGLPYSGKTSTLRELAKLLGSTIQSPGERDGRTMFFDWVDYRGGLFDGHPIRCQLVSVPGQGWLVARRRALLETADAVVAVVNTSEDEFRSALHALDSAKAWCATLKPPVGIVVQANQRDLPNCVTSETLHELVQEHTNAEVIETIATAGSGVRSAFVAAVRLALARVRTLTETGEIETALTPEAADQLFQRLVGLKTGAPEPWAR